jgi:hypothetical protein
VVICIGKTYCVEVEVLNYVGQLEHNPLNNRIKTIMMGFIGSMEDRVLGLLRIGIYSMILGVEYVH